MNLSAQVDLISCSEIQNVAFLLSQPNTNCSFKRHCQLRVSVEARDLGQPQVIDLLPELRVASSRMSKSRICCRLGLNTSSLPPALPLHLNVRHNRPDVNDIVVLRTHPCGFVTATNTEWGATGVCRGCSTTAYKAQRL